MFIIDHLSPVTGAPLRTRSAAARRSNVSDRKQFRFRFDRAAAHAPHDSVYEVETPPIVIGEPNRFESTESNASQSDSLLRTSSAGQTLQLQQNMH